MIRTKKQALAEARKRWGENAAIEEYKHQTTPEQRANAKMQFKALLDKCTTPELKKANKKELDRLQCLSLRYRYAVGSIVLGMFFSVHGNGDTWDEAFSNADKN